MSSCLAVDCTTGRPTRGCASGCALLSVFMALCVARAAVLLLCMMCVMCQVVRAEADSVFGPYTFAEEVRDSLCSAA